MNELSYKYILSERRKTVMEIYKKFGYDGVEKWFRKKYKKQIIMHRVYNAIPRKLRVALKNAIKNRKDKLDYVG